MMVQERSGSMACIPALVYGGSQRNLYDLGDLQPQAGLAMNCRRIGREIGP